MRLNTDPTDPYQKQIQQAIQKYIIMLDKCTHKHLMNIEPMASKLNAYKNT